MKTNLEKAKENVLNHSINWNQFHRDFLIENLELAAKPDTSDKEALNIGDVSKSLGNSKCCGTPVGYKTYCPSCDKLCSVC